MARVADGLALRYPRLGRAKRRLHARVTVAALKSLLALADASEPVERAAVLRETKTILADYLDQIDPTDTPRHTARDRRP